MIVDAHPWDLPRSLNLEGELARVRQVLDDRIRRCEPDVEHLVRYQMAGSAKYFRPATVLACHRAVAHGTAPESVVRRAAAVELFHNATLIVDDILDRSRHRRSRLSLHCRYGSLPALMAAGYLTSAATECVADEPRSVRLLAELMQRLAVAECYQWRVRRQPLGVEDWRAVAGEDTGSMFQICARLGTGDDSLSRYGLLLGILYHGCDDVADVREAVALGGGGDEDLADGILTLPAAIAMWDPKAAALFRAGSTSAKAAFATLLPQALPESEHYLDRIAAEARIEAMSGSREPEHLIRLVDHTRGLSAA